MSQSKPRPHKIELRNRPGSEDQITSGYNTQVFLDGKPLKMARFIKFEVDSRKVAKVVIELYAEIDFNINAELETVNVEQDDLRIDGKDMAIHTLSNPSITIDTNKNI